MVTSYSSLVRMVWDPGVPPNRLAPMLALVENYCKDKGYPSLTALVVNQSDGVPGHLFPAYDESQKSPPEREEQADRRAPRAARQRARAFVFDWPSEEPPDNAFDNRE